MLAAGRQPRDARQGCSCPLWLGGSGELVSASFCGFSHYKCTKKEKRNHIFATKDSARDRRRQNRDTESMASDPSSEIREQGLCKSFRLNLNVPICYMYFWDARATDFTLRSCMNDSFGQVFSLKKVVRRADYDLLILFLYKDRIKRQFFHYVGDQR